MGIGDFTACPEAVLDSDAAALSLFALDGIRASRPLPKPPVLLAAITNPP